MNTSLQLRAVLWDMDGTLVDTAPNWLVAHQRVAHAHGARWTDLDTHSATGQSMTFSAHRLQQCRVALPADVIAELLVRDVAAAIARDVPWISGARSILSQVRGAGIRCGLVTTAYRSVARLVADTTPTSFDVVVAGDDVTQTKPHPEPYLRAAAALGCRVEECVAVEDLFNGVSSAENAGMRVVVVPGAVTVPAAPGRHFTASLHEVTVDSLRGLIARN